MIELAFDVLEPRADRWAAAPTVVLPLQITETTGTRIHTIALKCQLRIEPAKRRYTPAEQERLVELFGEPSRWGDTLKPMQLANIGILVPGFDGRIEVDVNFMPTFDLEIAQAKYWTALGDGEVPVLVLFSGVVYVQTPDAGVQVLPISWTKEASCRVPVQVFRDAFDAHFPGRGWLLVDRDLLEDLARYKAERALMTWDATLRALLKEAGEA